MSCEKDYELLKKEVEYIESCEMTCEPGCNNAFKNIYECAERMATEIKREGKVSVELFDHVKELEAQLKTVEGREANLQEELGNAVAKIHELEVSRDEWKKQWELEVSGRRLAEKEVAKLKDGYKVALELVETAKKEKDEIQENLSKRIVEVTRLKNELSTIDLSERCCGNCDWYFDNSSDQRRCQKGCFFTNPYQKTESYINEDLMICAEWAEIK